jgi:hypothetical protein
MEQHTCQPPFYIELSHPYLNSSDTFKSKFDDMKDKDEGSPALGTLCTEIKVSEARFLAVIIQLTLYL